MTTQALKWWTESQHGDRNVAGQVPVATGVGRAVGVPRGWSYHGRNSAHAWGSMTAGAVGAVVIYNYMLKRDFRRDTSFQDGVAWMAQNFTVKANPGPADTFGKKPETMYYYYLYALERMAMLADLRTVGVHAWYDSGAKVIIDAQKEDGSWKTSDGSNSTYDTCFAILFLKRATRPVVASIDEGRRRK